MTYSRNKFDFLETFQKHIRNSKLIFTLFEVPEK